MGSPNLTRFNSSLETYTPLKRLGLSRKRKSTLSPDVEEKKIIKKLNNKTSLTPLKHTQAIFNNNLQPDNLSNNEESSSITNRVNFDETVDYEKEIKLVENRIEEKLKILSSLKNKNSKKIELQNLIEIWRKGCKSAFLYLNHLLKERQKENIRPKVWLQRLGIWKLMVDNFQEDSEINFSDDSD